MYDDRSPESQSDNRDMSTEPLKKDKKKKQSGGRLACKVLLLDGSEYELEMPKSSVGQDLVNAVSEHLNLAEKDYFSCSYKDSHGVRFWVGVEQPLSKSAKRAHPNWVFSFEVKFYPLDAAALHEDYTRYLLFLQTRVDIVMGKLPCSFLALALLGSYAVQSDLGDHNALEHGASCEYLRDIKFAARQGEELLEKIAELHKTHRGDTPSEVELLYLENAQMLALYGIHMHAAKDEAITDVNIGVGAAGLIVYKGQLRSHRFPWAKIIKIAYKRNTFTVRLRPGEIEDEPQDIVYKLDNNAEAKRLWRIAVEHHGFFRLKQPDPPQRATFPHFGSKFRFTGPTQHQARGSGEGTGRIVPKINRKASTRFIGAKEQGYNVGTGGFSTDRAEETIMEAPKVPTLDLKNKRKPGGSAPVVDDGDDRNLSVIDPGGDYGQSDESRVVISSTQVSYSRTGATPRYDQYGNVIDAGPDELSASEGTTSRGQRGPGGYDTDDPRYQEDQQLLQGPGVAGGAQWSGTAYSATSSTKTSQRTYTDSDGTQITEYITEKDGVIVDRRVEKRTTKVTTLENNEEDADYDEMLRAAIQEVTDMNPDMSVQKIEIHTNTET